MTRTGEPGDHVEPLTDDELMTLFDAVDNLDPGYRRVINIVPFTGLLRKEYTHLRESWIDWGDDVVAINIPETMPCTSVKYTSSSWDITDRDEPCIRSEIDDSPPGRVFSKKSRTIHVTESRAQNALRGMFTMADENPSSTVHIWELVKQVPIDFTYRQLRFTRLRLLGDRDTALQDIAAEWGIQHQDTVGQFPPVVKDILVNSDGDYNKKLHDGKAVLALLNERGPMVRSAIADALETTASSSWRRVETLEKHGAVEITERSQGPLVMPVLTVEELDVQYPDAKKKIREILALLNKNGPLPRPGIEDEAGYAQSTVHRRVATLKEYGAVEIANSGGDLVTPLKTVENATTCDICEEQFDNIRGLALHKGKVHWPDDPDR